jgi:hypothetical protein
MTEEWLLDRGIIILTFGLAARKMHTMLSPRARNGSRQIERSLFHNAQKDRRTVKELPIVQEIFKSTKMRGTWAKTHRNKVTKELPNDHMKI